MKKYSDIICQWIADLLLIPDSRNSKGDMICQRDHDPAVYFPKNFFCFPDHLIGDFQIKSIQRFCDNHIKNIKQTYGAKHDPSCNSPVLLLFVFCGSYFTPVRKQPNLRSLFLNLFLTFPSFSARIKSELKTRLRGNQICTE